MELEIKYCVLGLDEPEDWIRSEVAEDLPQFTRFMVLQRCWEGHVASWSREADDWIEG